jgi:outer membrane protein TolC
LPYSFDELYQIARTRYPQLQMQEREIERNQHRVELARREFYPDFTLGFTAVERTVPEMYGFMVNARVPLYFWRKQRPELESARLGLDSARKQRDNTTALLHAKMRELHVVATTSERLVELYRTGVVPQARLSLEFALASYQVGSVDFLTVLDNFVTLLDYELKYYEALTDYQKALVQLEPYTGLELVR